jgi:hypothetical protein
VTALVGLVGAVIHLEIAVVGIGREITKQTLISHSQLPPEEFKASLSGLTSAIKAAEKKRLKVSPGIMNDLQAKLKLTEASTPGFWPAAAEFVTYRSQLVAGWNNVNLPLCGSVPANANINKIEMTGEKVANGEEVAKVTHSPFVYKTCKIVLDSPAATIAMSQVMSFSDLIFDHCVIFYGGGPIVFVPVKVAVNETTPPKLRGGIEFDSCLFIFSLPTAPAPGGQKLITTLLEAPQQSVIKFDPNPTS